MPNVPLCALVHDSTQLDPHTLASSVRACLADIRMVLHRHGFARAADGLTLTALAIEDDLIAIAVREAMAGHTPQSSPMRVPSPGN